MVDFSDGLKCSVAAFARTSCRLHDKYPKETEVELLSDCTKDISSHLKTNGLNSGYRSRYEGTITEGRLIASRVGIFSETSLEQMTACPFHRYSLGLFWKRQKATKYSHPHHTGKRKPHRGISLEISRDILKETGTLVQVGSGICQKCLEQYRGESHDQENTKTTEELFFSCTEDTHEVDQPYHYRTNSNLPFNLTEVEEVDQPCQFRDRLHLPVMDTEVEEVDQPYHFRARLHMPVMNNDIESSQESRQESFQECTIETSQGSSWSYDSSTLPERNFELLNTTLSSLSHHGYGAVSPLRSKLSTPFIESADRTKRYYKRKAGQLISTLLDTIAPGQGDILLDAMSNDKKSTADTSSSEDITSTIVRLYNESTDTGYKVKILSIIVNKHSKSTLQEMIPGITVYRIDQARQHALLYGRGSEEDLVHTQQKRQRMDKSKLAHAVNFFTDPSFIQLVACGTRELNLDNGEKLVIPDIVRTTMHSTLVELYLSHCDETDSQPLSRSSLFRILNACSASKRSCLKGLDNISAEGSAAFDTCIYVISEIEKKGLLSAWSKAISSKLKSYKMYLKTDFKLHLEIESRCADHCLQWALSDTTDKSGNFKVHCLHKLQT
ncbi:unnamed protein product [Mytilus coruscus]|uniref:Uncharacterized protein n=1 Tax=Mytilus coruscus TaxID=42192 RepID=A0A6J8C5G7_MYTCO|nr:unnamed protein product [Mytilus coruscus]